MSKILGIRDKELRVLRKGAVMGAITYIMWFCSSFIVSFSFYLVYIMRFFTCKVSNVCLFNAKVSKWYDLMFKVITH